MSFNPEEYLAEFSAKASPAQAPAPGVLPVKLGLLDQFKAALGMGSVTDRFSQPDVAVAPAPIIGAPFSVQGENKIRSAVESADLPGPMPDTAIGGAMTKLAAQPKLNPMVDRAAANAKVAAAGRTPFADYLDTAKLAGSVLPGAGGITPMSGMLNQAIDTPSQDTAGIMDKSAAALLGAGVNFAAQLPQLPSAVARTLGVNPD